MTIKIKPAYKIVLSGLLENSWGDGSRRNTVWHAQALEDISAGRFRRKAGQLLCSKDAGSYGLAHPLEGQTVKIDCKACVARLEKLGGAQ